MAGREAFRPGIALLLTVLTCGVASIVYQCLYAFELERAAAAQGIVSATRGFGALIVALQVGSFVLAFLSGEILSIVTTGAIIALIQVELNKFATDD